MSRMFLMARCRKIAVFGFPTPRILTSQPKSFPDIVDEAVMHVKDRIARSHVENAHVSANVGVDLGMHTIEQPIDAGVEIFVGAVTEELVQIFLLVKRFRIA